MTLESEYGARRWQQGVVLLAGLMYAGSGAALLLAPAWFYTNFAHYPPFNRHFAGDLGTFLLPLGIGLLVVGREPSRHLGLIGVAAAASVLHAGNHAYDAVVEEATLVHWLTDAVPLTALAVLLVAAVVDISGRRNQEVVDGRR